MGHFLPFYPTNKPKSQNFEKIKKKKKRKKKKLEILSFYICLPRMTIIWCMVRETWSTAGKIFSHFGPFFVLWLKNQNFEKKPADIISLHLCTTNDNHMMYRSLDIGCNRQSFLGTTFCPFDPPKNLSNQNFDKMKKKRKSLKYYHLYHKCINGNHMMYGFWDMECDRLNFLSL